MTMIMNHVTQVFKDGPNEFKALDDVSMQIDKGEFVAVMGPSGSGKSTFLSTAGALLSPTSGTIEMDGEDLTKLSDKEKTKRRLRKIGFVFQTANLIPYLSALDQLQVINIAANTDGVNDDGTALLTHFGLGHRLKQFPSELSGGERQRVSISRALVNDPELILADEPTASLDSSRGREVVELLANEVHNRNKAGIMVTHDERVLDLCDRVLTITDGRLTESETVLS